MLEQIDLEYKTGKSSPVVDDSLIESETEIQDPDEIKYSSASGRKTIHLFPHSHTDLGWLSTVDEYFEGSYKKGTWFRGSVQDMLNSVVE